MLRWIIDFAIGNAKRKMMWRYPLVGAAVWAYGQYRRHKATRALPPHRMA
jgi:hypothetical protein